jgi:3-dehydroquinate synthase
MKEIQVGLGERAYPLIIREGGLSAVGSDLQRRGIGKRYVVVADEYVNSLYGENLLANLQQADLAAELLTFPRGEASKNLATVGDLASRLAQLGIDRKDALVALGGGVTGDLTGFLAAIYMRGIPFVQVPTSLLAQVDSSVGGKTGVDIPEGKNLIGAFYQPRVVYIDPKVLLSLPEEEMLNGLAEVIKYGVIYDADFFQFLAARREAVLQRDLDVLEEVIGRCCAIKAEVVAADEREADLRRILNFGHTLGHAVEAASGYGLAHGLAVAIGMIAAAELAVAMDLLPRSEADQLREVVTAYGLPAAIPQGLATEAIRGYLKTDKKTIAGRPFFVLPTRIGAVTITDQVPEELIEQVIDRLKRLKFSKSGGQAL